MHRSYVVLTSTLPPTVAICSVATVLSVRPVIETTTIPTIILMYYIYLSKSPQQISCYTAYRVSVNVHSNGDLYAQFLKLKYDLLVHVVFVYFLFVNNNNNNNTE